MKVATSSQMREIDRVSIEEWAIPGRVLMETAGRSVAEEADDFLAESGGQVLVLAGPGNNGGDGYVAARYLLSWGHRPVVAALGGLSKLSGDAAAHAQLAVRCGLEVIDVADASGLDDLADLLAGADVLIDAILGTGASGAARGLAAHAITFSDAAVCPVVSVDIPSGIGVDDGTLAGPAVCADVTVTFGLPKPGLFIYPAAECAGRVVVVDIGLPPPVVEAADIWLELAEADDVAVLLPERPPDAHKGDCGKLLVVAGSPGFTGAAALACRGALRGGAGLVTLAIQPDLQPVMAAKLTESMTLAVTSLDDLAERLSEFSALAIGPGLGTSDATMRAVAKLLGGLSVPAVVDADALPAVRGLSVGAASLVLTPHPGEMARLLGGSVADVQADRLGAARAAAETFGAVVVLKGASTVVADPAGRAWIIPTGNPGMASGGMGDVLTGLIGALLAGGMSPAPAAVSAAYLHGLAGDMAAASMGETGIAAGDVAERLPLARELIVSGDE